MHSAASPLARRVAALEKAFRAPPRDAIAHDMSGLSNEALEILEAAADWRIAHPGADDDNRLAEFDARLAQAGLGLRHYERDGVYVWENYPLADTPSAVAPPSSRKTAQIPHHASHKAMT